MILTFLFERLYFDQNFDQNSVQFFLQPLYFESNFVLIKSVLLKKIDLGLVPPPRLRKIRKLMVVPPSSRVLRSHARLAKSAGLAAAKRRHLLLIHSVEMHLISIKVLIEMYFILINILKNAPLSPATLF